MAIYRSIQMTFWTDTKVSDDFTPEDKYFYLYLFTNPHTNLCVCYEISKKLISWETGYSIDTIIRLIERFEKVHKVIRFNTETKEILIINWHKYNWTDSEKVRKPLWKEIESIKCTEFKEFLEGVFTGDTVSIGYPYPTDTTDTVTDTVSDTDTKKQKNSTRFVAPTVDEVKEYCKERNNNVDAERFVDFYESKGWMVGKNKMKSWKACVRTWEKPQQPKKDSGTIPSPDNDNKFAMLEDAWDERLEVTDGE